MRASGWAIIVAAAAVAVLAGRYGRSRLAVAIAVVGIALAALGVVYAALGYAGCTARGDCSLTGAALHTSLGVALIVLVVLVLAAVVRAGWRRRPRWARRPPRARGGGRMRARDVWMTVGGVLFAVFSIALLAFGDGAQRVGGLACLLVAAGGLLLPLSGRLAARSGIRPKLGHVECNGTLQPALVIPASAAKLRLMRLAMACFAAFGLLVAIWPRAVLSHETSVAQVRIVGIACVLVCGGLLLVRLLYERGRQRIALLASGVSWELGHGASFVAWDDVVGVRVYKIKSAWYLAVDARPGSRRDPPRLPWLVRLDRAVSRWGSAIPLEAFPVDAERLGAVVRGCAVEPGLRDGVASERSLAWLTGQAYPVDPPRVPSPVRETVSGA